MLLMLSWVVLSYLLALQQEVLYLLRLRAGNNSCKHLRRPEASTISISVPYVPAHCYDCLACSFLLVTCSASTCSNPGAHARRRDGASITLVLTGCSGISHLTPIILMQDHGQP